MFLRDSGLSKIQAHVGIIESLDDIRDLWNRGLVPVEELTSAPTHTPTTGELRLVKTGGNYFLYAFFPTDNVWKRVQLS